MDRKPSVLLIGNGAPGHIGGFFARALRDLAYPFCFIDESTCFAPPARLLMSRAADRLLRRPGEIRRFNERVVRTAAEFRPAVVLVVQGVHLFPDSLRRLRQETQATLVAFAPDDPLVPGSSRANVRGSIPEYDVYASPRRSNLAALGAHGCRRPVHVRFGYEPAIHFAEPPGAAERDTWASDVVFIGGADADRVRWFGPLSQAGDIRLRLYGRGWDRTSLRRHEGGEIFDRQFRLAMAGTKLAPCLVRHSNGDGHVMRSFEVPACGRFMLAERTEEHQELFEEDAHAAYFSSPEELRDKARYYAMHHAERDRMAAAAHDLVTGGRHTYRDRLLEILSHHAGN